MSISYVLKNRANLIAIFLCVVSVALLGLISYNNQANYLHTSLQGLTDNQSRLFQSIIKADIEGLARAHTGIDKLDPLLKPFASGKKDELLAASQPLFNEIRQNNNITHMYFIKPDGTVFLRVHKPEESGDKLSRITYVKAAETKKIASGIEMGKNFFSLRSVKPVSYQGNPIGYMEVAEEIDHVFTRMKEVNGNDVSVFLTDDFLKSQVTHVQGEKIGNFRLLYPTDRGASQRLAAQLLPAMQSALKQPAVTIVSSPEGKIVVGMSPFIDASGHTVGILFSHKDVTPLFTAMWHGVVTNVLMLSAIVLTALFMLFISLKKLNMELEQHAAALDLSNSELKQAETELLLREKSLANSERFLKTIIDTEPECIKMLDADCNLLMMNPAGLSMIEADSLEQVKGHCICPLVTSHYRDAFVALTKQVFQGIPGKLEFETVGLKGRHVWLETHAVPFRNEHDEIVSLLGITRDITERKMSEKALRSSEAKFSAIFRSSPDSININRLEDAVFVDVNEGFTDMLGYSAEDVIGKPSTEIGVWVDVEDRAHIARQLKETGEIKNLEARLRRKDGSLLTALVSSRLIEVDGVLCTLNIARDITELKHAEQEKQNFEKQLLHTQKLESLGLLAGGIAHDFNNILTSIVGNADLALMKMNPASPAIDNLHKIEQSAAKAADLAQQMLAYSGKGKFIVEPLDMNSLLEEILHMLEVSISKKVDLRLNLAPNLSSVEADVTQMRQVVMNLVINASEAIGESSGVIVITTGCMDFDTNCPKDIYLDKGIEAGRYVYLEISDNGCGMDKETLAKIFDPFFTTKFTGRGLGMAAVQGIIRGHKGFINVYSEPGKGTTFKVFLPASDKLIENVDDQSHKDDWRGEGTVLLVDDEETVRDIGKEMLKELGFTTITANDGNEAIEMFKAVPDIAFVILDLTMPQMDGEQCFYELMQLKPDIKVVMSSGFSEQEITQKFVGRGLAGFVQKPYKLSALKKTIQKILRQNII